MDGLNLAQASTPAGGDAVKKYNKSSFFDEISCDVLDRAQGMQGGRDIVDRSAAIEL